MTWKVAVAGATGNVGREMLNILSERQFPVSEVVALASRKSIGKEVSFGDNTLPHWYLRATVRGGRKLGARTRNAPYAVSAASASRTTPRTVRTITKIPRPLSRLMGWAFLPTGHRFRASPQ